MKGGGRYLPRCMRVGSAVQQLRPGLAHLRCDHIFGDERDELGTWRVRNTVLILEFRIFGRGAARRTSPVPSDDEPVVLRRVVPGRARANLEKKIAQPRQRELRFRSCADVRAEASAESVTVVRWRHTSIDSSVSRATDRRAAHQPRQEASAVCACYGLRARAGG